MLKAQIMTIPPLPGISPVPKPSQTLAEAVDDKLRSLSAAYGARQHVVMISAPPAAGKSAMVAANFPQYVVAHQVKLGNKQRCLEALRDGLACGKNVIVNRTNASDYHRRLFTDVCKELRVPVHMIRITSDYPTTSYMNLMRFYTSRGTRKLIPVVGITDFYREVSVPAPDEGFASVTTVPWVLRLPDGEDFTDTYTTPPGVSRPTVGKIADPEGPLAQGTGKVSASRALRDYFFQRVNLDPVLEEWERVKDLPKPSHGYRGRGGRGGRGGYGRGRGGAGGEYRGGGRGGYRGGFRGGYGNGY
jgi:uncharacterized membrane protein YgcG